MGGYWAYSPQTKLQAPKLKCETLSISGVLSSFRMSSPPFEDFLATVLASDILDHAMCFCGNKIIFMGSEVLLRSDCVDKKFKTYFFTLYIGGLERDSCLWRFYKCLSDYVTSPQASY